jgi:hypothetical protein
LQCALLRWNHSKAQCKICKHGFSRLAVSLKYQCLKWEKRSSGMGHPSSPHAKRGTAVPWRQWHDAEQPILYSFRKKMLSIYPKTGGIVASRSLICRYGILSNFKHHCLQSMLWINLLVAKVEIYLFIIAGGTPRHRRPVFCDPKQQYINAQLVWLRALY